MRHLRRRTSLCCLAAAIAVSACTAGGDDPPAPQPPPDEQVTVSVWSNLADRELEALDEVLNRFEARHPNITVEVAGNQDDNKITQAIRGGLPPDVAVSSTADNVGQRCSSGAWQDLAPYIRRDGVDLRQMPEALRNYTQYRGTRCAMPMLADTYGLYYNKDLFAEAGITRPPRTMSELADYTRKLTERNADGSIKVAGFVPQMFFYQNRPAVWAPLWDAGWVDSEGRSALATDPAWQRMFRWQERMVDFYGWQNLQRFTSRLGMYSAADQGFHTGEVAMTLDAEYRTAFIADQAPHLNYGTAPAPVDDRRADSYGGGYVTGTTLGIPTGADHPGAAWEVVKYLSTDTGALVHLANEFGNVPSTYEASRSPELDISEQFRTFVDVFNSPHLQASPPTPNGAASMISVQKFFEEWQTGATGDLHDELARLDSAIDAAKALGRK